MDIDNQNGKWYHYKGDNYEYYSATTLSKKKFYHVSNGDKLPTAKEISDLFDKIKEKYGESIIKYPEHCGFGLYSISIPDEAKEVELPSGSYKYVEGSYDLPDRLVPINFRKDGFVKIGDVYDSILEDIKCFIEKEEVYRKLNIIYKRGLLLYGPPGQGKTALIRSIVHKHLPEDAVVIMFDGKIPDVAFLTVMKMSLEKRMKLFIFEELTDFMKRDNVDELLTFLDGEFSIDKSLIIATTNYPEKLPCNIVDRPSRFDKLYKIDNPNKAQRRIILNHYLQRDPTEEEVIITDKLSTAAIKEVVLLSNLRDFDIKESVSIVKKHSEIVKKNFEDNKERIGL